MKIKKNMYSNQLSQLLEENPGKFLNDLRNPEFQEVFAEWVKYPKSYHNWFSPALTQLILLVGDLTPKWLNSSGLFGQNTRIAEDMGIEIFDLLLEFKPDLEDKDYYNQTFMDILNKYETTEDNKSYLMRKNNERFLLYVKDKLNSQ